MLNMNDYLHILFDKTIQQYKETFFIKFTLTTVITSRMCCELSTGLNKVVANQSSIMIGYERHILKRLTH